MKRSAKAAPVYDLRLYVSGATPRSRLAISNIKDICAAHLPGRFRLQVVDIYQNPEQLAEYNIIAAPTLIKQAPPPVRRFVGDLSDTEKVTKGLALAG